MKVPNSVTSARCRAEKIRSPLHYEPIQGVARFVLRNSGSHTASLRLVLPTEWRCF